MSRCSSHRQCLDQACSTSPLSRISSNLSRTSRKIERFCCFTRDHKRYPSSASALSFFVRSLLQLALSLLFWHGDLPFSAYIRNTHRHFMMPPFLVISTRSRISINNKNPTKIYPNPILTGLHISERLQHIVSASFQKVAV